MTEINIMWKIAKMDQYDLATIHYKTEIENNNLVDRCDVV